MTAPTSSSVLSVSQLNRLARSVLEDSFARVWVEGELTNWSRPASGHWYFTLKDDRAQIRAAMFRGHNLRVLKPPSVGQRVRVQARISLYEARGDYQLIVETLQDAGEGDLHLALERLRARLAEEGLFAAERKRALPRSPRHIAVVTSASGAALRDILAVLARRSPATRITLLPVAVQGQQAAAEISAAIQLANRLAEADIHDFDVLLCGRGGGSLEDLWCFNEEVVVRAIAASRLPVVSAVGHEVDVTLSDLAADRRAPTPSAAAELLSPDRREQLALLARQRQRLETAAQRRLQQRRERLSYLLARLRHPGERLQQRAQRLDDHQERLLRLQRRQLEGAQRRWAELHRRLLRQHPGLRLQRHRQRLLQGRQRLEQSMVRHLERSRQQWQHALQRLHGISPLATLDRGYAILRDEDGRVLRRADQATPGQVLQGQLAEGRLRLKVLP